MFLQETVYNDTLECVRSSFPQYVRELEGVADGAQVEFHKVMYSLNELPYSALCIVFLIIFLQKLFLLHMDDITPNATSQARVTNQPIGCSTICVNEADHVITQCQ